MKKGFNGKNFYCTGTAYSRKLNTPCPYDSLFTTSKQCIISLSYTKLSVCAHCKRTYLKAKWESKKAKKTAIALICVGQIIGKFRDVNKIIARVVWEIKGVI